MPYETLLTELSDSILTVTLNRPDRLNAFTEQMMRDLLAVCDEIDAADDVRAVVVTGAGRGFCAGADLGGGGETFKTPEGRRGIPRDGGGQVALRLYDLTKPVIAAINGPAVGVGATMTLPMDVRLASESARFGFVFARRGLVPEACSSWFLPRVVGINRAMEWVMSGRVFPAQDALAGGLVSRVLPPEELLPAAREIARECAENTSAISMVLSRQLLWKMLGADHPMEAHKLDSRAIDFMGASDDVKEGVSSFLEKRPASFPMRPSRDLPDFFPWWDEREFS